MEVWDSNSRICLWWPIPGRARRSKLSKVNSEKENNNNKMHTYIHTHHAHRYTDTEKERKIEREVFLKTGTENLIKVEPW